MTAAVVAPLSLIPPGPDAALVCDASAEARKRRRDILATQRTLPDSILLTIDAALPPTKKAKTEELKPKKPQMKYDPDVPMSKEEAAAWRREQRRKRNRESAAASRQRQRDRVSELEAEAGEWKTKYEETMKKIQQLEAAAGIQSIPQDSLLSTRTSTPPPEAQTVTPRASPTSSTSLISLTDNKISTQPQVIIGEEDLFEDPEPIKMISRPA